MSTSTVFACENQPVMVEGLVRVFESSDDLDLIGHTGQLELAIQDVLLRKPDVILLGQPPAMKSILPMLLRVRESGIASHIVLWVTELSDMDSFRALQMGARGVVTRLQRGEILLECVRSVARGTVWLEASTRPAHRSAARRTSTVRITRREREIIEFVCRGMKNKEIAASLSITPGTVKVHLMHIFEKTGVKDRFQLALQGRHILGPGEDDNSMAAAAGSGAI